MDGWIDGRLRDFIFNAYALHWTDINKFIRYYCYEYKCNNYLTWTTNTWRSGHN